MKKFLFIITPILITFFSILLIKTFLFSSKQLPIKKKAITININTQQTTKNLAVALKFKTISFQNPSEFSNHEFISFHKYLEQVFPKIHSILKKEVIGNHALLYTWKGQDKKLKPILFMAHMDVVPVEPGTEKKWQFPPFSGKIAKSYIWGRGSLDDKGSMLSILQAVEILLNQTKNLRRTIYLAFGSDEEIGGKRGTVKIASVLRARGVNLDYVLDEGGGIISGALPGLSKPVAVVGIAEKGYLSIKLSVQGQGGHSSMPPKHTAIGILSNAVYKLEQNQLSGKIKGPLRQMFEYIGPEMPFHLKIIFANLWFFKPLLEQLFSQSYETNALLRTTTALTMFKGGIKENVLPTKAWAVVNFRIYPGESVKSILKHVQKTINDTRIKITPLGDYSNPSKESSIKSQGFKTIQQTIQEIFPDTIVAPWLVVGATDSRHYSKISNNTYRFAPLQLTTSDLQRIHGANERISIKNYEQCIKFYYQLMLNSI